MRYVLVLWAVPLIIFWGWFTLSYYDLNFGYLMLSRQVHDLYFQLSGQIIGVEPSEVPWLLVKAFVFDTLILMAIWAFRRRRELASWLRRRRGYAQIMDGRDVQSREAGPVLPAE